VRRLAPHFCTANKPVVLLVYQNDGPSRSMSDLSNETEDAIGGAFIIVTAPRWPD
jgi:hypothetical protein